MPQNEVFPKAKAAALKAQELDDSLAEVQTSLGWIKFSYERDWQGVEKAYRRALGLNPGYSEAHLGYAYYLSLMGRHDEAITEIRKAWEIDPLSMRWGLEVGRILYHARRYDEAIQQYQRWIELYPSYASTYLYSSLAYVQKEMYPEAIAAAAKGVEIRQRHPSPSYLAYAYAVAGRTEEAREILHELERESVSAGPIAFVYSGLGEKDSAFAWLDKAYDSYDSQLFELQDPVWDPLRDDPRFKDLLRRLNLPVE